MRHFIDEDIQITNEAHEDMFTSLAIKQIQIETTVEYHYMPIKMAKGKRNSVYTKPEQAPGS